MFATVGGQDTTRIPAVIDTVGLEGRGDDRYRSYSLGMKQRLGIAAALLGDPELLILDEPANGLDPQGVREMRALVGDLAGTGRTVLVSSHDLSELEQVCDWLVLIETAVRSTRGRPSSCSTPSPADSRSCPSGPTTTSPCESCSSRGHDVQPHDDRLVVGINGSDVGDLAAAVNRAAFDAGIVLVELSPLRTTLEDRYLALVQGGVR